MIFALQHGIFTAPCVYPPFSHTSERIRLCREIGVLAQIPIWGSATGIISRIRQPHLPFEDGINGVFHIQMRGTFVGRTSFAGIRMAHWRQYEKWEHTSLRPRADLAPFDKSGRASWEKARKGKASRSLGGGLGFLGAPQSRHCAALFTAIVNLDGLPKKCANVLLAMSQGLKASGRYRRITVPWSCQFIKFPTQGLEGRCPGKIKAREWRDRG